jgi:cytochrome c553
MKRKQFALAAFVGLAAAIAAHAQTEVKGDPAKAQLIIAKTCVACHGPDGNSPIPANPKLAGLQAGYIVKQLSDFKKGARTSDVMAPMVADLSPEDINNLAVFYAGNKMVPGAAKDQSVLAQGKKIYLDGNPDTGVPSCSGCHYPDGSGTSRFPRLAGQHAEYVLNQLKLFAAGKRENDRGLVMQSLAVRMSEKEMLAVSEYIASMAVPAR